MAKAASSNELRAGFEKHLEQTKGHVQRLEEIVQSLDESPKGKKCVGMEGLVKEGSEVMAEDFDDVVLDAGLIGAARRVEHYEMAAYAAVYEFAMVLGQTRQASLLERTLAEEKQTDDKLAELARKINAQANEEGLEEEQGAPRSAHKTPKRAA
jgi:ferritin-like metal-binding protein YciE